MRDRRTIPRGRIGARGEAQTGPARVPEMRHSRAAMALLTPLDLLEARRIGAEFGLQVVAVADFDGGSVNSNFALSSADSRRWFLRIYEEQDHAGARREVRLLHRLDAAGVPTTAPLSRLDGEGALSEHVGKPVAILPWIDGRWLRQREVTTEHCQQVGAALACVHLASPHLPAMGEGRFRVEDIRQRLSFIRHRGRAELVEAAALLRQLLDRWESERRPALAQGLIHGDLFRDNILWKDGQIAALIDFESAAQGPFAYDLMVTLLAWCFTDRFELPLVAALLAGYRNVRPQPESERSALRAEGAIACIRFATTRITDFSMRCPADTTPKRDYRRFLQRLAMLESGVLDGVLIGS
jgi:homoserine kinase type II